MTMLAIVREITPAQIVAAIFTVALPVAAVWWCFRLMRSDRSSTFDLCPSCGAKGRRYDQYCPRCSHGTKPSPGDGYARLDVDKLQQAQHDRGQRTREASPNETKVEVLE